MKIQDDESKPAQTPNYQQGIGAMAMDGSASGAATDGMTAQSSTGTAQEVQKS